MHSRPDLTENHIEQPAASGLIQIAPEASSSATITQTGQQPLGRVRPRAGAITQRLVAGLPAADLQAADRVLNTVLERAEAELRAGS